MKIKFKDFLNENTNVKWSNEIPTKDGYYFVLNINERNGSLENKGVPHIARVFNNAKYVSTTLGYECIKKYCGIGTSQGGPRLWSGPFYAPSNPSPKFVKDSLQKYKQEIPGR